MVNSLDSALKIGISGLTANQFALTTTANNISNVNSAGYVKKTANFEAQVLGGQQAGVRIAGISRTVDQFLVREERVAIAQQKRYEAMQTLHTRLQSLLGSPGDNVTFPARLDQAFEEVAALASQPESVVKRVSAVNALQDFADEVGRIAQIVQDLRAEADRRISEGITIVNNAIERIADLNPLITRELVLGNDASALMEQRDRAIREISEYVDVRVNESSNGGVGLATSSGIVLLDAIQRRLVYQPQGIVGTNSVFDQIEVAKVNPADGQIVSTGTALDTALQSGSLRGLLDMRDKQLPAIAVEIGELSGAVIDQYNAAHNDNTAVPPPSILVGRNIGTVATDPHGFTGVTTFATVDANNMLLNRATVDFSNNTISVNGGAPTALGGNTVADVMQAVNTALGASTLVLNGGAMTYQAPAGATGVAILQDATDPSQRGGRGFSHFFGLNDLMSARVPAHFDTGVVAGQLHGFGTTGSMTVQFRGPNNQVVREATIDFAGIGAQFGNVVSELNAQFNGVASFALDANGALTATPTAGFAEYKMVTTDDTTDRNGSGVSFSEMFGLGDRFRMDKAFGVTVRQDILDDPVNMALAKLDLSASALAGTVPTLTIGDNRGVVNLQDVASASIAVKSAGDLSATNTTLTSFAASVLSDISIKADNATRREADASALSTEITTRISGDSGVNLDEELANMILFQNAFNASARLVSTTREMFNELLSIVR